jgi:hypothetical protein
MKDMNLIKWETSVAKLILSMDTLYKNDCSVRSIRMIDGKTRVFVAVSAARLSEYSGIPLRTLHKAITYLNDRDFLHIRKADWHRWLNFNCYSLDYEKIYQAGMEGNWQGSGRMPDHYIDHLKEILEGFDIREYIKMCPMFRQRRGRYHGRPSIRTPRHGRCGRQHQRNHSSLGASSTGLSTENVDNLSPSPSSGHHQGTENNLLRSYLNQKSKKDLFLGNKNIILAEQPPTTGETFFSFGDILSKLNDQKFQTDDSRRPLTPYRNQGMTWTYQNQLAQKQGYTTVGELYYEMGRTLESLVTGIERSHKRFVDFKRPARFFAKLGYLFKRGWLSPTRSCMAKFAAWIKEKWDKNMAAALSLTNFFDFLKKKNYSGKVKCKNYQKDCLPMSDAYNVLSPEDHREKLRYELIDNKNETIPQKEVRLKLIEKTDPKHYAAWLKDIPFDGESDYIFCVDNLFMRDKCTQLFENVLGSRHKLKFVTTKNKKNMIRYG